MNQCCINEREDKSRAHLNGVGARGDHCDLVAELSQLLDHGLVPVLHPAHLRSNNAHRDVEPRQTQSLNSTSAGIKLYLLKLNRQSREHERIKGSEAMMVIQPGRTQTSLISYCKAKRNQSFMATLT